MVYGAELTENYRLVGSYETAKSEGFANISDHYGRITETQCRNCEREMTPHDEVYNRQEYYGLFKQYSYAEHYCLQCVRVFARKEKADKERFLREHEQYQTNPVSQSNGEFGEFTDHYNHRGDKYHVVGFHSPSQAEKMEKHRKCV